MKFNRLDLIAYGPFSGTRLDFEASGAGLHLVFGPNEAGKSTTLRALRNLLFGIPTRSPDNFRHPHPKLRIGARLIRSDGETLDFIRRKGLRKTLRGADDRTPLDDTVLTAFLGGVDRELFEQMFAIDHRDLIRGGKEIVAGGGRIGQALFAAGAGLIRLQQFQQSLDAAMEDLFKAGGSKPRINQSLAQLKKTRQNQKNALLLVETWKTHHSDLQANQTRQEINRQRLAASRKAHNKLERLHEALPLIARRKEIMAILPDLADAPDLPEDFADKRRDTEKTLAVATHDAARAGKNLEEVGARIAALAMPEPLLQQAPLVEALQHDLGSFKKAQADRPSLEARRQTLEHQAAETLSEAGLTDPGRNAADLRLSPALVSEIQERGQAHDRLTTRLASLRARRRDLETDIALLEAQKQALPPLRDTTSLKSLLQTVVEEGPLEKRLSEMRNGIAQAERGLEDRLQRQTLWSGTPQALTALPLPPRASIERFVARFTASGRQIERLREEIFQQKTLLNEIAADLQSFASVHPVPAESDLQSARTLRDRGWRLARRHLEGEAPPEKEVMAFIQAAARGETLPEALEADMARADHLADRLRREAEQVSRQSMLEARRNQAEEKLANAAAALDAARAAQNELDQEWQSRWAAAGIRPQAPAEMLGWLVEMEAVRDKASDLAADKREADDLAAAIAFHKTRLIEALAEVEAGAGSDHALADLIERARRQVARHDERRAESERTDQTTAQHRKELKRVLAEMADLETELAAWQTLWGRTVSRIGLEAEALPEAALAMIESIRQARIQQNEAEILGKRVRGIDRDADHFRQRVARLVARLAPGLSEAPPEEACLQLNARLTEARAVQSRKLALERQRDAVRRDLDSARARLEEAAAAMQALCREAGCDDPGLLPEIEKSAARRLALLREQEDLENRLRRLSAGATVETFTEEAAAMDPDALTPQMAQIADDIASLERERSEVDQAIGTARAELRRMDGRAEAAGYAEEAEHLLAALESDTERYARLKIASAILARTIERYREKHQGPLIQRASTLFARMTLDAFSGLRAEYDESGNPVLMGIRSANGDLVGVSGMSDGTADQLYLALRLASLERYLDASEPLPFVVDDILLRFDDERAAACLEVLAELAFKTQVIFFTHHQHLLDLAQQTLAASTLAVYRLENPPSAAARN